MRPVLTKQDMYVRWLQGEFGNRLRGWVSYEELMASSYNGAVNIRNTESCFPKIRYDVPKHLVLCTIEELGGSLAEYRFNEPAPDHKLTIQGELAEGATGWWLTYSTAQQKMREAMQAAKFAEGLIAKSILRSFCCPSSLDDLYTLLELYPKHVIEFGVYEHCLGDAKHRNTIIWEVRRY